MYNYTLTVKNELTSPPPSAIFVTLIRGGEVSPVCKKIGILFKIEKGVGQNVVLTRGGEVSPVFQKSGILFNIEKGVGQN